MSKLVLVSLIGQLGYGGSERQLYLLQTHLDPALFERHVVVFNPSKYDVYDSALKADGVTVWAVPADCHGVHQRLWFVWRLLRTLKADIVHSWTVHDNPYAGIAGRLAGVRVRWGSLRGSLFSKGMQALPPLYRYLSLNTVQRIVVNADNLFKQLENHRYPVENIALLPNVVTDLAQVESADLTAFNITSEHLLIGIVGNIRRVKNHALFVRAVAKLSARFPNLKAVIVGREIDDELDTRDELINQIATLGMQDTIHLLGFRADVAQLLRRFDIFCLTSNSEGMSNAMLEAMSACCPVIVTHVGAAQEVIVDGENGYLIAPGDEAALVEKASQYLTDPLRAQQMAEAGYVTVREQFGCQQIASRLSDWYLGAIKAHEQ